MSFEETLVDLLQADTSITATVNDRIWPVAIRMNPVFPAITYARTDGRHEYALDAGVVWAEATIAVRCWARDYPAARALAEDVRAALDRQTTTGVDVVTVSDGADMWLDAYDVLGCTLLVRMEKTT